MQILLSHGTNIMFVTIVTTPNLAAAYEHQDGDIAKGCER